jgi:hypothetical protein
LGARDSGARLDERGRLALDLRLAFRLGGLFHDLS